MAEARSKLGRTLRRPPRPPPTSPLPQRRRRLVRLCTDPTVRRDGTSGAWCHRTKRTTLISRAKSALRWPPSRANPSRGGDAKPGIFSSKTARLPEPSRDQYQRGANREGEPGALHRGVVAPGDDRPDARRGSQVEL